MATLQKLSTRSNDPGRTGWNRLPRCDVIAVQSLSICCSFDCLEYSGAASFSHKVSFTNINYVLEKFELLVVVDDI